MKDDIKFDKNKSKIQKKKMLLDLWLCTNDKNDSCEILYENAYEICRYSILTALGDDELYGIN